VSWLGPGRAQRLPNLARWGGRGPAAARVFRLERGPARRSVRAVPAQPPPTSSLPPALAARLAAAGIDDISDPVAAWFRLRQAAGRRITGIDLYELAAAPRGLAAWELPRDERRSLALAAISAIFPGFSLIPGTQRTGDPLEVAPYDPDWPRQYAQWRELFVRALGASALRTEHAGSTAVPGLAAKPVIDVQISVADVTGEPSYVPQLEAAGLQLRVRDDARRLLFPLPGHPRNVHVHICTAGGTWEREHLLFRDYVRAHPAARDGYAQAKLAAIHTWADDRFAYGEAKTAIILDILDAAGQWATATHWSLPPAELPR
jgi:GrpB-like predicted nucleotidyltransferase (UPF0157 family)